MKRIVFVTVVASLALAAGCSSSHKAATVPPAAAPSTSAAVASPSGSATPLAFYAAQYERLVKSGNDALDGLTGLSSSATDAEVGAAALKAVPAIQAVDVALVRAQWPANVTGDIRALVAADGPVLGDLAHLTAANIDQMLRDAGSASVAANIVRADLGLPPKS